MENGILLAVTHSNLIRRKSQLCDLLEVYGINGVRQTEMHTAENVEP